MPGDASADGLTTIRDGSEDAETETEGAATIAMAVPRNAQVVIRSNSQSARYLQRSRSSHGFTTILEGTSTGDFLPFAGSEESCLPPPGAVGSNKFCVKMRLAKNPSGASIVRMRLAVPLCIPRRAGWTTAARVLGVCLVMAMSACGGSNSNPAGASGGTGSGSTGGSGSGTSNKTVTVTIDGVAFVPTLVTAV